MQWGTMESELPTMFHDCVFVWKRSSPCHCWTVAIRSCLLKIWKRFGWKMKNSFLLCFSIPIYTFVLRVWPFYKTKIYCALCQNSSLNKSDNALWTIEHGLDNLTGTPVSFCLLRIIRLFRGCTRVTKTSVVHSTFLGKHQIRAFEQLEMVWIRDMIEHPVSI